eukprot:10872524-Prorocentrum_lima.AAC.1
MDHDHCSNQDATNLQHGFRLDPSHEAHAQASISCMGIRIATGNIHWRTRTTGIASRGATQRTS